MASNEVAWPSSSIVSFFKLKQTFVMSSFSDSFRESLDPRNKCEDDSIVELNLGFSFICITFSGWPRNFVARHDGGFVLIILNKLTKLV